MKKAAEKGQAVRRSTRNKATCGRESSADDRRATRRALRELDDAVSSDDRSAAATALRMLAHFASSTLPARWLLSSADALESGDWTVVGDLFRERALFGPAGDFVIVGPFTVRREADEETKLSYFHGRVRNVEVPSLDQALLELLGELRQPVTEIVPVARFGSGGQLRGEEGEAFIVPDGWTFPGSSSGPALNNMTEQSRRFIEGTQACIQRIFHRDSADFLLAPLRRDVPRVALQSLEYQLHEAGHASGLGLEMKVANNLLTSFWFRSIEEWRADGVAFALARRRFPSDKVGRIVASNLCTRFGLDAHRGGGVDRDLDVNASLLTLNSLLKTEALDIRDGRLAFHNLSYEELASSVDELTHDALNLTRTELHLGDPMGLQPLYGSAVKLDHTAKMMFEGMILNPCRGIFMTLR